MAVHVVTHEACVGHEMMPGHPESPRRLLAIYEELRRDTLGVELVWHEAPLALRRDLESLHPAAYVDRIRDLSLRGGAVIDPDTAVNAKSWEAAQRAAGAGVLAVELALTNGSNVFVPIRPPGHHAEADQAMGFCLFGNVAIAARAAVDDHGLQRVLIVDWDVHHGNGTQALVEDDPRIRFISLHQWPLYPGTGRADERGVDNVWNLPRPAGLRPGDYVRDLRAAIDEAARVWVPQLILISAGYDSMLGDPLAGFTLQAHHYDELAGHLRALGAPVVAMLEGGYHLDNLRAGVRQTVVTLGA